MPRGIPHTRFWRGRELIEDWLARQQAPLCACGCGERITLKKAHRHAGIPRFILGHHARVGQGNYKGVDLWVTANQGRHFCACGCGRAIVIEPRHHAVGIPRYLPNHSPRPAVGIGEAHPAYITDRDAVVRPRAFPAWMKEIVFELFGHRCAWCGALDVLECDHIVPASLGGMPVVENAQALCPSCHRWKSAVEPTSRKPKSRRARKHRSQEEPNHGDHRQAA